jgi:hypothetical protein
MTSDTGGNPRPRQELGQAAAARETEPGDERELPVLFGRRAGLALWKDVAL